MVDPSNTSRTEVPWREHLLRRLVWLFTIGMPIIITFVWLLAVSLSGRIAVTAVSGVLWIFFGVELWRPWLPHRLQAWLLVSALLAASLTGYALVGVLAGPALVMTVANFAAGLLLGKRALLIMLAVSAAGLGLVGWAVITGWLPPISEVDVAMTSPRVWLRTSITAFVLLAFILVPVLQVITQLEATIERVRVAERERLEAQRAAMQAQKLEAIGALAAGVAHDINNLLAVVETTSSLLIRSVPPDSQQRADLEAMREVVARGAGLTRQLLRFTRRQHSETERFDAGQRVRGLEQMLGRLIGNGIAVTVQVTESRPHVNLAPSQFEQIVLNLAINARDAMPSGGKLRLETSTFESRAGATTPMLNPGSYLRLVVEDSGHGMDAETREHALEPFFTTKPEGRGTGLGLWTVSVIVQQAGGGLDIDSAPGRGTRVSVFLPLADAHQPTA